MCRSEVEKVPGARCGARSRFRGDPRKGALSGVYARRASTLQFVPFLALPCKYSMMIDAAGISVCTGSSGAHNNGQQQEIMMVAGRRFGVGAEKEVDCPSPATPHYWVAG